jgi:predicted dehydrogenase
MDKAKLRVGLVGCGHVSQYHIDAWAKHPDVTLVGVCDRDVVRAKKAASAIGITSFYTNAADLIRAERLDILDIATRSASHAELVRCAADANIHVLCQKPLGASLREASQLVETCETANVRFMVLEMARFLPWIESIMSNGHRIAPLAHFRYIGERDARRFGRILRDQPYLATETHLIIRERLIHSIDLARLFLGDVDTVYARASNRNRAVVGEDAASVLLGHRDGGTSLHDFWWPGEHLAALAEDAQLVLEGVGGTLRLSFSTGELLAISDKTVSLGRFDSSIGYQQGFDRAIASLVASLKKSVQLQYPASQHLNTIAATEGAYESAVMRQVVHLD